jgi:hypothetical protein
MTLVKGTGRNSRQPLSGGEAMAASGAARSK